MKKIVGILGAAVMLASSVFAADMAAKVYMTGNVAGRTFKEDATEDYFWNLAKQDQKDADALVISTNGDKSGANFQFWYNYDGSGSANLVVRSTNLWFKPIDMVKVTVGDLSVGTYKEMIDWWKVAVGNSASAHNSWGTGGRWSSYATVEAAGLNVEVTPISGLTVSAGIAPGAGNNGLTFTKDSFSYAAWGALAQYDLSGLTGLPVSAAISWRDSGKDGYKILAVGGDYGSKWSDGFYGFLNARFFFEDLSFSTLAIPQTYTWSKKSVLTGIALDNYAKYQLGALKVAVRAPVTIRLVKDLTGNGVKASDFKYPADPSYLCYEIKVTYGLGAYTPYLDIENDNAVTFDSNFGTKLLKTTIQPGVSFNVGSCSIDVGVNVDLSGAKDGKIAWSVPFQLGVAF
jgi:hypothetical protein